MEQAQSARPGALRRRDGGGAFIVTNPGDPLFSSALMAAEEYYDGVGWHPYADPPEPRGHDLYKTGDADAPSQILDRNGHVALSCCRRCGRGEIELSQECVG